MPDPEAMARMCWAKIERLLYYKQPGPPEETCRIIMSIIQAGLQDAQVADPPWSVIMANLDAAIAKGQGIRRQALLDAATAMCGLCIGSRPKPIGPLWYHTIRRQGKPCQSMCEAGVIHDMIAGADLCSQDQPEVEKPQAPTPLVRSPSAGNVQCGACDGRGLMQRPFATQATTCTRCGGSGEMPAPQDCPSCGGHGFLLLDGGQHRDCPDCHGEGVQPGKEGGGLDG